MRNSRLLPFFLLGLCLGSSTLQQAVAIGFRLEKGWITSRIEQLLNAQFGGRVQIIGDIAVDVGRELEVEVGPVIVSNPDWAGEQHLARFETAKAVLPVSALLSGDLRFARLELHNAAVNLREAKDGRVNWTLAAEAEQDLATTLERIDAEPPTGPGGAPPAGGAEQVEIGAQVPLIEVLSVTNLKVTYRSAATGRDIAGEIAELSGRLGDELMVELAGHGSLAGRPLELRIDAGELQAEAGGDERVPLSARLAAGDTRLTLDGSIASVQRLDTLEGEVRLETGPDSEALLQAFDLSDGPLAPLTATAEIIPASDGSTIDLRAEIGANELHLDGRVADLGAPLAGLEIDLAARGERLGQLLRLAGVRTSAGLPAFELTGQLEGTGGRWWLRDLVARLGDNRLTGRGEVAHLSTLAGLELRADLVGPTLGELLPPLGRPPPTVPTVRLALAAEEVAGRVRAALAGTMAGDDVEMLVNFDDAPQSFADVEAELRLRGSHLGDLVRAAGVEVQGGFPPYRLAANVAHARGGWAVEDLAATMGANSLLGEVVVGNPVTLSGLAADLAIEAPELQAILSPFGLAADPAQSLAAELDIAPQGERTSAALVGELGETEFRLVSSFAGAASAPDALRLEAAASGSDASALLRLAGLPASGDLPGFELDGGIEERAGAFEIERFQLRLGANHLRLDGRLGGIRDLAGTALELTVVAPSLEPVAAAFGAGTAELPDVSLDAALRTRSGGEDLRLTGLIGDDLLAIDARLRGGLRAPELVRAELDLQGNDVGELAKLAGLSAQPGHAYHVDLIVRPRARGSLAVDLAALVGRTRLAAVGDVADPLALEGVKLDLWVKGDSPPDLLALLGVSGGALPPYDILAQVRRDDGRIRLRNIDGVFGDSDIHGEATVRFRGADPIEIDTDLRSRMLDLDDLFPFVGLEAQVGEGEIASPEQRRLAREPDSGTYLFSAEPISLDAFRNVRIDLQYAAERVLARRFPIDELAFHLTSRGAALSLEPLTARIANGQLRLRASLDGNREPARGELDLAVSDVQLRQLLVPLGASSEAFGRLEVDARLDATGQSLHRLASTADGPVRLLMTGGQIDAWLVEAVGLDLGEVLAIAVGTGVAGLHEVPVPIRCVAADMDFVNGFTRPDVLLADTRDTLVTASGSIDLDEEELDIVVRPYPRDVSVGSLRVPIRVVGDFRSLGIRPAPFGLEDPTLAWLLGPVGAVLPFVELGGVGRRPCPALEARLDELPAASGAGGPPGEGW